MKVDCIFTLSVLLVTMSWNVVQACCPDFPMSYFPHVRNYNVTWYTTTVVSTNAAVKSFDAYKVSPHLGTELAMIGAHYYPAWTGKAPKSNRVSTAQADRLDFFAAGAAASVSAEVVAEDWRRFSAFNEEVCRRLEQGEAVKVPAGVPDYALEFYLYKLGHAQWLVFRKDEDPEPFGKLLALPRERRLYRTVWVHFVRLANARKFSDKDRHLDALRRSIDTGFKDTAALESFALRFLSCTCENRYDPLVLTAYAHADWKEWPGFAKRLFCRRRLSGPPAKKWIENLCADIIGVEVAIAYGAGGHLPPQTELPKQPVLAADRQAWIAFDRGNLELCRKLHLLAPRQSLVRLFLEARLARLDGDYEKSALRLHEWLTEYRRKGTQADVVGYGIDDEEFNYWFTGMKWDGDYCFRGSIHYTGFYGPSGRFWVDLFGCSHEQALTQSHEPTLSRIVAGELGVVKVMTRDLEEALHAFLLARNWIDIAFVAERCMTVDELMRFMWSSRLGPDYQNVLRDLLMRRLIRAGRIQEAVIWAPPKLKPLCDEYSALSSIAGNVQADRDVRAVAFFNLSRLTVVRGMELMGTELRPDMAIYRGSFSTDDFPLAEPTDLVPRMGRKEDGSRWDGWKMPADRVSERFHYRRKAVEYARASVELAKDTDVRAWALMLGGVAALTVDDAQTADWFYKRLARMHHARAKVGGWFNNPEYFRFKDEFYSKERYVKPLRVPPRFTIEQFKQLSRNVKGE